MISRWSLVLAAILISLPVRARSDSPATVELPGPRPDGSVLLPNQWSLRPAGRQVTLGDFPVNIAVSPDGRFAAVLHCGDSQHGILVVDIAQGKVVCRTKVHEAFYGLQFAPGGSRLYCSGAGDEVVHVFDFKDGYLSTNSDIQVCDPKERGIPCGMALSGNVRDLYVVNLWGQCVSKLNLYSRTKVLDFTPLPGLETNVLRSRSEKGDDTDAEDLASVTKRMKAELDPANPDSPFPYACALDDRRQILYVSLWGRAEVAVVDLKSNQVVALWPTEEHPNEMVLSKSGNLLFVANANRNTVTIINTRKGKTEETLFTSYPYAAPPGSAPESLALSPDESTLYIANACNNNLAVFDVSVVGRSRSLGFIPTGWYPTSVRVTPDGKHLLVANGKGLISLANPQGPVPGKKRTADTQYIGSFLPGALSIIDLPSKKQFPRQMAAWTKAALECTPAHSVAQIPPDARNPIPATPGGSCPIKYCLYIVKENRTYDQVFGDLKQGNGDSNLCLFPERVTPNHHRLASDFVLLDNFYVDAEVSADGHEWSMGAFATDFVEKNWPLSYGHNQKDKYPYPSEGHFAIARPAGGYLWDRAAEAGVSYFSYGEFVSSSKTTNEPCFTRTEALKGHFDPWYRGFDIGYRDVDRAGRFIQDLKQYEAAGAMPRLQILRLPNDHTAGGAAGKLTPTALLADNDRALGLIVEAVSHSRFWPETAIFVLEDDAQNGPDHVDAHRSPALVLSPYTRRKAVDSTMYSTSSMVRTIELILGLQPMSQYDAAATPMYHAFDLFGDPTPYDALPETVDLNATNPREGKTASLSRHMDFRKEDLVDDQLLNEVIWKTVHGEESIMPSPTRAAFVYQTPKMDKDED